MPQHQATGGAGAKDGFSAAEDLKKMAHQLAGGTEVAHGQGKLAATGLISGIFPGNLKARQQLCNRLGRFWGALIYKTGDKKFDRHSVPFSSVVPEKPWLIGRHCLIFPTILSKWVLAFPLTG
jgi:hypothetical protein